ncbi:MAG TPA: C40 family peptidase [Ideonella sp.]|nr:C40 family peptidase [Ideonella sp.]
MHRRATLCGALAAALLSACGSLPGPSAPPFPLGNDVAIQALGLVGTPYRLGGTDLAQGVDCSAFIGLVYRRAASMQLPRTVATLQKWGRPVDRAAALPGDVILFQPSNAGAPTHGGVVVGGGRFVHAPSTGGQVRVDSLGLAYWSRQGWIVRRAS